MKTVFTLIIMSLAFTLEAGGFYGVGLEIDTYDPISGNYYHQVTEEKEKTGFLSKGTTKNLTNIAIFNPKTNTHKMLLDVDKKRDISIFIFESGFKEGSLEFNSDMGRYGNIKNNTGIAQRQIKDKLLIGIKKPKQRMTELYTAKKDGSKLQKLTNISFDSSWHLDSKNSKIRIITVKAGKFNIVSFDW